MKTQRLYKSVADALLKVIESGQYAVGERLPAERDLAAEFNVSRPTIREAVIALEIAGRVEVRKGSGVYVINTDSSKSRSLDLDVGPFELTEARMLIEGEAAGLAATMISDEEIEELSAIIHLMQKENDAEIGGEHADRNFHLLIARATRNSAIVSIIEDLWSLREKSELTRNMYKTVRMTGVQPSIDEHWAIYNALKDGDAVAARTAMRTHLSRVIDTMFEATEIEAVEKIKEKVSKDRHRFSRILQTG
ncbi:FadR/GntR family transcriptional regulator [Litorimonas sp. RW-G-Af-16]|uniref:FadR/GntR family transcriptional regulator n=1 Tax=Litorimonas sp. RW-G-Af-16 TaxID=3241168 RepID=UPI00390C527F